MANSKGFFLLLFCLFWLYSHQCYFSDITNLVFGLAGRLRFVFNGHNKSSNGKDFNVKVAWRSVFLHSLVCIQLSKLAEIGEIIPDALKLLTGNIAVSICVEIFEDRLRPWKQDRLFASDVNSHAFAVTWWFDSIWFYAFLARIKRINVQYNL